MPPTPLREEWYVRRDDGWQSSPYPSSRAVWMALDALPIRSQYRVVHVRVYPRGTLARWQRVVDAARLVERESRGHFVASEVLELCAAVQALEGR